MALRGTIQTGFRAPTPGQSNVSNVSTVYNADLRDLVEQGLTPPTDPVAMFYGGQPLQPEESTAYTFGLNWAAYNGLNLTVDVFRIEVDDRLAPSSEFSLSQADVDELDRLGIAGVTEGSSLTLLHQFMGNRNHRPGSGGLLEHGPGVARRRNRFHRGLQFHRDRSGGI